MILINSFLIFIHLSPIVACDNLMLLGSTLKRVLIDFHLSIRGRILTIDNWRQGPITKAACYRVLSFAVLPHPQPIDDISVFGVNSWLYHADLLSSIFFLLFHLLSLHEPVLLKKLLAIISANNSIITLLCNLAFALIMLYIIINPSHLILILVLFGFLADLGHRQVLNLLQFNLLFRICFLSH